MIDCLNENLDFSVIFQFLCPALVGANEPRRAQSAYNNLLQPPLMTNSDYAIFISRFLNSLSEGHISPLLNQLAPYDWAASPFTFTESQEGLVLTGCKKVCAQIALPALVTAIDDENPEVWIQKNLEFSIGSTVYGKRYYTIRGLSQRQEVLGTTTRPKFLTIELKGTNKKTIPFNWTTPNLQSVTEKKCASSLLAGKNLVVKVPSFMCEDSLFPQDNKKGFEKFSRELLTALSSKNYNKLIIDLRGNSGGLPRPAQELLSYFITEPLFWFGTRNIMKLSQTRWNRSENSVYKL